MKKKMKTSNAWFKRADMLVGLFLIPLQFYFSHIRKRNSPASGYSSFLIVKLCCLGDSMLSLMAIHALRTKYPDARLTVLCSQRNGWIYERSGIIDETVVLPITGLGGFREIFSLHVLVRQLKYLFFRKDEVLLDFDIYYRFTTLLSIFPGKLVVAGFRSPRGLDRTRFYDIRVERGVKKEEWRTFFDIAGFLGVSPLSDSNVPLLRVSSMESEIASGFLARVKRGGEPVIAIVPGSSDNWPEKRWAPRLFAATMDILSDTINATFVIIGTKSELALSEQLISLFSNKERVVNLAGKTPPGILVAVVRSIDGMISNDTGPMHIAALMDKPVVGLFGPTDEKKWSPPSDRFVALTAKCDKRPCDEISQMPECCNTGCMSTIEPEAVSSALIKLMKGEGE